MNGIDFGLEETVYRCKVCGISTDGRGIHTLRHFFVTHALKTMNIHTISKYIGHKDIRTTFQTYNHLLDDHDIDCGSPRF